MNGRIHLKNMVFFGYHGDLAEENTLGQRFVVDLTLCVDIAKVAGTDDLADTVDYGRVYEVTRAIVEEDRVKLLETLAVRIVDRLLAEFSLIDSVEIVVKKPSVPLNGALDYVAVEATKTREKSVSRTG